MDDLTSKVFGRRGCAILAIILVAAVVVGEIVVVTSDRSSYGAEVVFEDGHADYNVTVAGSDIFDAVLLDREGSVPVTDLTVFVDEKYGEFYSQAEGLEYYIDQDYTSQQIAVALSNRGFDSIRNCDSSGLESFLEDTMDDPAGYGLMVTSFALPSSVYSGNEGDLLLKWISAGGTLYWMGSEIGRYYVDGDRLVEVEGYQELLFGTECINEGGPRYAESVVDNGFTEALTLSGSDLLYALDVSRIPGSLSLGYEADGYSTISLVPYGSGEICVFAGDFDIDLLDDMGQVVASGVTCETHVAGHQSGHVIRDTTYGSFEGVDENSTVYIYVGGMYVRFAEVFHV